MTAGARRADRQAIEDWLVAALARLLVVDPGTIDAEKDFESFGLGSTELVQVAGDLEEWLGCDLPATLAFDHPSIAALARHLSERLGR